MRMFKLNAAHQMRNLVQRPKRGRPIRDGQAGIVAGYQSSCNGEQKRDGRRKDGEAMVGLVVGYGRGLQKKLLGSL